MRKVVLVLVVAALSAAAAACGGSEPVPVTTQAPGVTTGAPPPTTEAGSTTVAPSTTAAAECAKENLPLKRPGVLTIGTGNPAYPPWFEGGETGNQWKINDPANGKGFEGAVAYAVADQLGFTPDEVTWVPVGFNQSIAPGPKKYDFNLQQISYSPKRAQRIGLSESYYDVNQALVSYRGSRIDDATSFADLAQAKLGAPVGTTSYDYITQNIQPSVEPAVYDDLAGAVQALKNHQIDGVVVDLPTAFYLVAVEIPKGVIVGQFPTVGEQEHFSLATEKNSPLLPCLNTALEALKTDGTLEQLQQTWLSDNASAPVISG